MVLPLTCRVPKKVFFNEECIIKEENNKRGKPRELFRKIGNIKGPLYPKMGTMKDKNLVDTEEIKMEKLHGKTVLKRS